MRVLVKRNNEYVRLYPVLGLITLTIFTVILFAANLSGLVLGFGLVLFCFLISLKRLSYTYWSLLFFQTFILIYILCGTEFSLPISQKFILLSSYLILYGISAYLFNPIIFPAVNWLEYDFRYRHDLECYYCSSDGCYESRLVDLKGSLGSLHSFQSVGLGEKANLVFRFRDNIISLNGEVQSIRQNSLGRGFYYGINFGNSESVKVLMTYWKAQKVHKKSLKKKRHGK